MIKGTELYAVLSSELPEISDAFDKTGETNCPYKVAAFFAAFTKKLIYSGHRAASLKCFDIAEEILINGDPTVKNAIENVYVFSVSQINPLIYDIINEFPPLMKKEYKRQVNAGCI